MNDPEEKTVFELNNEAIFELQKQQHDQAIAKLQRIAVMLQADFQDPASEGFRLKPGNGYGSQYGSDQIEEIALMTVPVNEQLLPASQLDLSGLNTNPASVFRFFDQAFVTIFQNYEGTRGQRLVFAFVLYNLGLSYHHREVKNNTCDAQKLKIALRFYKMALEVMEGACDDGDPQDVLLLLLAIFNNLGHIYSSFFCMIPETRFCAGWMRTLLASKSSEFFGRLGGDLNFFCLSAVVMPTVAFSLAPAA